MLQASQVNALASTPFQGHSELTLRYALSPVRPTLTSLGPIVSSTADSVFVPMPVADFPQLLPSLGEALSSPVKSSPWYSAYITPDRVVRITDLQPSLSSATAEEPPQPGEAGAPIMLYRFHQDRHTRELFLQGGVVGYLLSIEGGSVKYAPVSEFPMPAERVSSNYLQITVRPPARQVHPAFLTNTGPKPFVF